MEEGIHDQQRQAGNDNGCILEQLGHFCAFSRALNIGNHTGFGLALDQDRAQHQLQGLFGGTVQVDHRVKIAVPHSYKLPKSKHRHYRHTNRQQDIKEVAHFAGTIHIGCLTKLTRDPLIVGTGNDHIPDAECTRQDNRPHGIQQTDIVDEQVGRDQTAVEEHRDNE